MMKIEIRPGEGGNDSKLLVKELSRAYEKLLLRIGVKFTIEEMTDVIVISMDESIQSMKNEAGGHRFQRIPPTEKKGRVHTSTVTVAVMDETTVDGPWDMRSDADFRIEWYSGSGSGGQHRNKCQNSCRIVHIPSGIVTTCQDRSRSVSHKTAMHDMISRLDSLKRSGIKSYNDDIRRTQIGSGMRGDKIRTIRFQDDIATDHRYGFKISAKSYMDGNMDKMWR